jgi:hypothetical protein
MAQMGPRIGVIFEETYFVLTDHTRWTLRVFEDGVVFLKLHEGREPQDNDLAVETLFGLKEILSVHGLKRPGRFFRALNAVRAEKIVGPITRRLPQSYRWWYRPGSGTLTEAAEPAAA